MTALLKDIHFGIRVLLKHPGLTVAALLCLGLGIGATVTMFTMVLMFRNCSSRVMLLVHCALLAITNNR